MAFLHLVTRFDGRTIKVPVFLESNNNTFADKGQGNQLIIDTGADYSALTEWFLRKNGYTNFYNTGVVKRTAAGYVEFKSCQINGMVIANQFKIGKMKVDVLTGWEEQTVVGVIGMDILARMTFILSHEHKKFMLSSQPVSALNQLFT